MTNADKIFLRKTLILEKKYLILLTRVINQYRKTFISDLTLHGTQYAQRQLHLTPIYNNLSPVLQSIYKDAGLLGARMSRSELRTGQKAAGFGKNDRWIAEVLNYLRFHMLKFVSSISETMREDIIKILEKGVSEGWGIDKIVNELGRQDLTRARARVIARTEVIRAANVGHSVGAKDMPFEVNKKWNAAKDHRTRHSHRSINGHITEEMGMFKVAVYKGDDLIGYEEMLYPGDAEASAGNTINCRCRVTYIPKRDAQGKLIRRVANTATIIPLRPVSTVGNAYQIAAALKANIFVGIEGETE